MKKRALFYEPGPNARPIELSKDELDAHLLCVGGTRSGKTVSLLARAYSRVADDPRLRLFAVDWLKNDCSAHLLELARALHRRLPQLRADNLVVIRPFGPDASITPVNIMHPAGDIRLQALGFADFMATGVRESKLSAPMRGGTRVPALGVLSFNEQRSDKDPLATLLDFRETLANPSYATAFAQRLKNPSARRELMDFRLAEATRTALLTRVDLLLALARLLCSQNSRSLESLIGRYHVIVDLTGGGPGSEAGAQMVGRLLFHGLAQALHQRKSKNRVDAYFDEAPELLRTISPVSVERLTSQSASKAVSLHFAAQDLHVMRGASADVTSSLLTNCFTQCFFQPKRDDLRHLQGLLEQNLHGSIVSDETPDRCLTKREELARLIQVATSLPRRHALLARRLKGRVQIGRVTDVPVSELKRRSDALPPDLHHAFTHGRFGSAPGDLPKPRLVLELEHPADVRMGAKKPVPELRSASRSKRPRLMLP